MKTFTIKYEGKKHRVCLSSFYPTEESKRGSENTYHVSCGTYDKNDKWTGLSIRGSIPIPEMIRWAYRKGLIKFERREL